MKVLPKVKPSWATNTPFLLRLFLWSSNTRENCVSWRKRFLIKLLYKVPSERRLYNPNSVLYIPVLKNIELNTIISLQKGFLLWRMTRLFSFLVWLAMILWMLFLTRIKINKYQECYWYIWTLFISTPVRLNLGLKGSQSVWNWKEMEPSKDKRLEIQNAVLVWNCIQDLESVMCDIWDLRCWSCNRESKKWNLE